MKKITATAKLRKLNKRWGLDFVSTDMGTSSFSWPIFPDKTKEEAFMDANTYLVFRHFTAGMNFKGNWDDKDTFYIAYHLGHRVTMDEVCEGLEKEFGTHFKVFKPEDSTETIRLERR